MKGVLMLVNDFPPAPVGGAERQAERLSMFLAGQGIQVNVITRTHPGLTSHETRSGFGIFRVMQFGPNKFRKALFTLGALVRIFQLRDRFDVLHAHLAFSSAVSAAVAGRLLRKQVIVKFGTGGASSEIRQSEKSLRGRIKLAILRTWVDRYISLTEEMDQELLATGFSGAKILRMGNGIDASLFSPAADKVAARSAVALDGKTIVLFTGRLVAVKGVPVLLRALARVNRPELHLVLAGEGADRASLEALVDELGLHSQVTFAGDVKDVKPYLQAADIFVLPSLGEGISNSLLEAMSAGVACVATRVGGAAELLEQGRNGILIEPNTVDELAQALATLAGDSELRNRYGQLARDSVLARYDIGSVGARYIALYNELAGRRS